MKENKNQQTEWRQGYATPSVRVFAGRTSHTILAGSEYSTNPTEMGWQDIVD